MLGRAKYELSSSRAPAPPTRHDSKPNPNPNPNLTRHGLQEVGRLSRQLTTDDSAPLKLPDSVPRWVERGGHGRGEVKVGVEGEAEVWRGRRVGYVRRKEKGGGCEDVWKSGTGCTDD